MLRETSAFFVDDAQIALGPNAEILAQKTSKQRLDVDFTLAIYNRTGKFFIGEELLALHDLPIGDTYFGWWRTRHVPRGLIGRIIGRLQHWHATGPLGWLPGRRSRRPVLHLDPFTVRSTKLRQHDAVLIHDLGPISHQQLFDPAVCAVYSRIYAEIARVDPNLIFVSDASRAAFGRLYPNARPVSTRVIYPPVRAAVGAAHKHPIDGIDGRFLLTVGSIGLRKNQARSIAAYARSGLAALGVQYVLCGALEPGAQDVQKLATETPGVILLAYVSDAELAWLYANAEGFVLMSVLEGFGMPVIEAIQAGLIPLISHKGALFEVAGAGALVADPENVTDIAEGMRQLGTISEFDRARRKLLLAEAGSRFGPEVFKQQWREAIYAIISTV